MSLSEAGLEDNAALADQASLPDEASLPEQNLVQFNEVMKAIRDVEWESVPGVIAEMTRMDFNNRQHPTQTWPTAEDTDALEQQRDALHSIISQVKRPDGHDITEILRFTTLKALIKAVPAGELRANIINMPGPDGVTALELAVQAANPALSIVEYLIKHGANRYNHILRTPIDIARAKGIQVSEGIMTLIHSGHKQEHGSSSVPLSDVYVYKKDSENAKGKTKKKRSNQLWKVEWSRIVDQKPVSEVLHGPFSLLEEFRRRHRELAVAVSPTKPPTTLPQDSDHWLSCWVHLPEKNLEWIKTAARHIFSPKSGPGPNTSTRTLENIIEFITYMGTSKSLAKPGNYFPGVYGFDLANKANVQCIVLPIMDIDDHPLHRHQRAQALGAHDQQALFEDQTLDEYCYESLEENELKRRDGDQVFSRYSKRQEKKDLLGRRMLEKEKGQLPREEDGRNDKSKSESQPVQNKAPGGFAKMVVVSHWWIWLLGDVILTNYKRGSAEELLGNIRRRCGDVDPGEARTPTQAFIRSILDECVKNEPFMPNAKPARLLDGAGAFASEIAFESKTVAGFYHDFEDYLGKIDKKYFSNSIRVETQTLLRLDDILDELAMMRRVQEDIRLVFLDVYDFKASIADRLIEKGRSKLDRLEGDALRVRKSLVTLLSLQQREVNTEGLFNSEFQTQIVFIFTAATVFFAPLSWVTSLLALTIQDFTPADSSWSRRGVATASSVTVAGFALLIVLGWLVWQHQSKLFSLFKSKARGKSDNEGETSASLTQDTVAAKASGRVRVRGLLGGRTRDQFSASVA